MSLTSIYFFHSEEKMASASALPPAQYLTTDHQNTFLVNTASTSSWANIQNSYTSGKDLLYQKDRDMFFNKTGNEYAIIINLFYLYSLISGPTLRSSRIVLWTYYALFMLAKLF